jgi:hypothetical protein
MPESVRRLLSAAEKMLALVPLLAQHLTDLAVGIPSQ